MVMIHFSLPVAGSGPDPREKVDVVGGVLLAIALGLAVVGLYNPAARRQAGAAQLAACRC